MAKRCFDVSLAVLLLIVFAPLMLLIALAIKFSSGGAVIYRQTRVGQYGKPFTMYKFVTMRDIPVITEWTHPGDIRVTFVGRLIRPSHFDELPQLVNVIRGEMSLVGPRPISQSVAAVMSNSPGFHFRHIVKPGITGLAQLKNGKSHDMQTGSVQFALDAEYISINSFWFDLKILILTIPEMLLRKSY